MTVSGYRKTKQLTINDIRFYKNNTELKDKTNELILFADTVTKTFVFQKKQEENSKRESVTRGKEFVP